MFLQYLFSENILCASSELSAMGAQCIKALNVHFIHFQLLWNKDLVVPINLPRQRSSSGHTDPGPAPPIRGRMTDDLVLEDVETEGEDTDTPSHEEDCNPQLGEEGVKPKNSQTLEKRRKRKKRRRQRRNRGRRLPVEPLQISKPKPLPPIQAVGKKNKAVPSTLSEPSTSHVATRQAWTTQEMTVEDIEWEDRDPLTLPPVRPPIRILVQNKALIGSEAEYLDAMYLNIPCYDEGYNPLSDGEDMEELEEKVKEKRRKREERLQRRRLTAAQIDQLSASQSDNTPAIDTCTSENTEKKSGSWKSLFKKFWQKHVSKRGTKA